VDNKVKKTSQPVVTDLTGLLLLLMQRILLQSAYIVSFHYESHGGRINPRPVP
jgi:hypothetical protein